MSQENVDRAVRAMRAATAPSPDLPVLAELYAIDHVFVPVGAGGIEQEAEGIEGFQEWRRETTDHLAPEFELGGAVDIGPSTVLAVWTVRGRGASSGITLDERLWMLVRFKGEKIVRSEAYATPEEALEAVGLSE